MITEVESGKRIEKYIMEEKDNEEMQSGYDKPDE